METLYTAKDAAIALGKPQLYRTLARTRHTYATNAPISGAATS